MRRAAFFGVVWCVLGAAMAARAEPPEPVLLVPLSPTQAIVPTAVERVDRVARELSISGESVAPARPSLERRPALRDESPPPVRTPPAFPPAPLLPLSSSKVYREWRQGSNNAIRRSDDIDQLRRSGFGRGERINRDIYWLRTGRTW